MDNYLKSLVCGLCCLLGSMTIQGQNYQSISDSLQQMLSTTVIEKDRVDLLNEISYNFRRTSPENVLDFAKKAESIAHKINYQKGLCVAYKNMGIAYYKLGKPINLTSNYYQLAISIAQEIGDYYTQAACNNNIALLYNQSLDYNTALKYYLKGIEIFDQHFEEGNRLKALMLANVSNCFFQLKDYNRALAYGERSISIARKYDLQSILSMYLDDLAQVYTQINEFEKSEQLLQEARVLQKRFGDHQSYLQTIKTLVDLRLKMEQPKDSKLLINDAINLATANEFNPLVPGLYNVLGKVYLFENKYDSTLYYCNKAYASAVASEDMPDQKNALEILSSTYHKKGQYQKAYELFYSYHVIQDSMQNAQKFAETSKLESIYQNRVNNQKIDFLQQEKANQKLRISLLLILCFIALSSVALIFYFFHKKKKSNRIIQQKNKELEKYISSNMQLENFAYIASHDLKTPLRTIVSFTQLLRRKMKNNLGEAETDYLNHIITGAKEMTVLIEDLLSYAMIEKKKLRLEQFKIEPLVKKLLSEVDIYVKEQEARIYLNIQAENMIADPILIKHVLQNLLTNAIKFTQEGQTPKVWISAYEQKGKWLFQVRDNGIGIDKEFHEKIFLIFKRLNNKLDYDGSGIGLAICKKVIDLHQGEIWLESEKEKGTTFSFTIPMVKMATEPKDKQQFSKEFA
ncbi:MAG: ATP-binding protein [Saprospiraceae bacterium]